MSPPRSTARRSPRPRPRRASAATSSPGHGPSTRPAGPPPGPTRPPCSRPVESRVHAVPGESTNLKVTLPDDLARVEAALIARGAIAPALPAVARRLRRRRAPVRTRRAPGAGRRRDRGRAARCTVIPTATSRSTPSATRCSARPASVTSGATSRPGRRRPPGSPAGSCWRPASSGSRTAGFAPVSIDVTIVGTRPRLAGRLDEMAAAVAGLVGPARGS